MILKTNSTSNEREGWKIHMHFTINEHTYSSLPHLISISRNSTLISILISTPINNPRSTPINNPIMTLKHNNQLKISFNNVQNDQLRMLSHIYGVPMQEIIRKAIDCFARLENEKRLRTNPNAKPLAGF